VCRILNLDQDDPMCTEQVCSGLKFRP